MTSNTWEISFLKVIEDTLFYQPEPGATDEQLKQKFLDFGQQLYTLVNQDVEGYSEAEKGAFVLKGYVAFAARNLQQQAADELIQAATLANQKGLAI